jgi:hypothetical protein
MSPPKDFQCHFHHAAGQKKTYDKDAGFSGALQPFPVELNRT